MKIDNLDIRIIQLLSESEITLTSTFIMKNICCPRNRTDSITKNTKITYRLKQLVKHGFLIEEQSEYGYHEYRLNIKEVQIGPSKLMINGKMLNTGKALAVDMDNGSFFVVFLPE